MLLSASEVSARSWGDESKLVLTARNYSLRATMEVMCDIAPPLSFLMKVESFLCVTNNVIKICPSVEDYERN
jgi:hypothetical protein